MFPGEFSIESIIVIFSPVHQSSPVIVDYRDLFLFQDPLSPTSKIVRSRFSFTSFEGC